MQAYAIAIKKSMLFICGILFFATQSISQQIPKVPNPSCAECGRDVLKYGHAQNCSYYRPPQQKSKSTFGSLPITNHDISKMVAGTIMQSLLTSIFSTNTNKQAQDKYAAEQLQIQIALQKAKQQKIKDSIDMANYQKLMSSYKALQGSQILGLKTVDTDLETASSIARAQFDGLSVPTNTNIQSNATNFFGIPMASPEFQTLTDPDKDSIIMDIDQTEKYLKEQILSDSAKVSNLKLDSIQKMVTKNTTKKSPECETLQKRLNGYQGQRIKFQQTIIKTNNELNQWKNKNKDALWNAATSGFELMFGKFLDKIESRASEAEKIKNRILPFETTLREKGVDIDKYLKVLNMRINNYNYLVKDVSEFKDAAEYNAFFRDGVQMGMESKAEQDLDYQILLNDTTVQQVLNTGGSLKVDAAQFVAGKVIDKFLKNGFLQNLSKFNNKIPYVSYAQFTVDQVYNATDWYLSYKQIKELHQISGQELQSAMSLQMNIDKTIRALSNCN